MKKIIVVMVSTLFIFACAKSDTGNAGTTDSQVPSQTEVLDYSSVPDGAEFIFIAAHVSNLENYNHQALLLLKTYLENNSNGRIGLQIYPNAQLASNINEGFQGINDGTIDIFQTTGDAAQFWPPISIFDLPYMLADDRLAESVVSDPEFLKLLRDGALEAIPNIRLMMIANSGGWRNFATVNKQIKTPADVKGLKIRTTPSKVQQELVKILDGTPTSITWPEVYTSLSSGVVEGTKNGVVDIQAAKFDEVLKYITLDGHAYMAGFWWLSQPKYMALPDDLKTVVNDGFLAMRQYLFAYPKHQSIKAYQQFRERGITIYRPTPSEIRAFQTASASIQDWFLNDYAKDNEGLEEWLNLYKNKIREHETLLRTTRSIER